MWLVSCCSPLLFERQIIVQCIQFISQFFYLIRIGSRSRRWRPKKTTVTKEDEVWAHLSGFITLSPCLPLLRRRSVCFLALIDPLLPFRGLLLQLALWCCHCCCCWWCHWFQETCLSVELSSIVKDLIETVGNFLWGFANNVTLKSINVKICECFKVYFTIAIVPLFGHHKDFELQ